MILRSLICVKQLHCFYFDAEVAQKGLDFSQNNELFGI